MIEHRFEIEACVEDGMTEGMVGGGSLQLVTVCLSDEGAGEVSDALVRPPVVTHLRPREARELAFWLLELAEVAERRTEAQDEPA